ncbi:MAG: heparinase II/III family protein [Planctomycetales bacterium]|nr:heparinase II/III family protein [Planctomycetales bacterium]
MSADEIRFRLLAAVDLRRQRREYLQRGREVAIAESTSSVSLLSSAQRLLPGSQPADVQTLRDSYPDLWNKYSAHAREEASAIHHGNYRRLGHVFNLADPISIDWRADPRTNYRWPKKFYADVAIYELSSDVDVKYVWEASRQQYLVALARNWRYSAHEESAVLARQLLLSWVQGNPYLEGVNWTSALEVAMRSISWLWSLALLAEWDGWSSEDLDLIGKAACQHAEFLRRNYSLYSSPYNHLIGEAAALYLLGCWLAELPAAASWRTEATQLLLEHGPKQFYEDGFCVEQAVGYHYFTLGFLAMAREADRLCNYNLLGPLDEVIARSFRSGAKLRQPDGLWPPIGDVDSARSMPIEPAQFWDFAGLCSLGAAIFREPLLKVAGTSPGEELFLQRGAAGIDTWKTINAGASSSSTQLTESGYVVLHTARQNGSPDWLLLDAGPLAAGLHADSTPSVAHGHLDCFQVLAHIDNRPILVDSGMPTYAGDLRQVDFFRSPAAHNTIEIEEFPMAQVAGRLAWSHVVGPPRVQVKLADNIRILCVERWLPNGGKLERQVIVNGEGIWILDLIDSPSPVTVHTYWNFAADLQVDVVRPNVLRVGDCHFETSTDGEFTLWRADKDSFHGWRAPGYGEKFPAHSARTTAKSVVSSCNLSFLGHYEPRAEVHALGKSVQMGVASSDQEETTPAISQQPVDRGVGRSVWRFASNNQPSVLVVAPTKELEGEQWNRLLGVGDLEAYTMTPESRAVESPLEMSQKQ